MIGILGAGGHGQVVASALSQLDLKYVFYDDNGKYPPIVACHHDAIVAIGDNAIRKSIYDSLDSPVTLVHPAAFHRHSSLLGWGTFVNAGAVVNTQSIIHDNVIINTSAIVDHHCVVKDHAHVAPGAVLCGGVTVEEGALVGANATVLPGATVPAWTTVKAGSVWK